MHAKTATAIAAQAAKAGSKATGASGGCRASSGASSALRSARPGAVYLSPRRRVTVIVLPGDHHFPCALLFGVEQRARLSVNVAGMRRGGQETGNREQGTGNREQGTGNPRGRGVGRRSASTRPRRGGDGSGRPFESLRANGRGRVA